MNDVVDQAKSEGKGLEVVVKPETEVKLLDSD